MQFVKKESGREINGYVPARVVEGGKWYVEFYSYDPELRKMRRKRMYVPKVRGKAARRTYAEDMAASLNQRLRKGWNPFLQLSNPKEYAPFEDVCKTYYEYQYKLAQDKLRRKNTYNGYTSFLNRFMAWNREQPRPVVYVYQLKADVITDFLDYIWIHDKLSARTRDNYLGWLRTFTGWMREKQYISEDPTAGLAMLQGKKKCPKNRTVIPKEAMVRMRDYLQEHDRHLLLACYVLYYCFVRPREMSFLRVRDVSVLKGTVSIHGEEAKNRKDATVTVPDVLMKYMIELKVLEQPGDWFLFSDGFRPGPNYRLPKYFSDGWHKAAKALDFPPEWKFYSLKDTGITDLIKDNTDLLAVRDQARHQSLQMTDLYTPLSSRDANHEIKTHKSYF